MITSNFPHKLSILIIFTALCLASNYALIGLPQVKIMDFLVFTGGFLLITMGLGLLLVLAVFLERRLG